MSDRLLLLIVIVAGVAVALVANLTLPNDHVNQIKPLTLTYIVKTVHAK